MLGSDAVAQSPVCYLEDSKSWRSSAYGFACVFTIHSFFSSFMDCFKYKWWWCRKVLFLRYGCNEKLVRTSVCYNILLVAYLLPLPVPNASLVCLFISNQSAFCPWTWLMSPKRSLFFSYVIMSLFLLFKNDLHTRRFLWNRPQSSNSMPTRSTLK